MENVVQQAWNEALLSPWIEQLRQGVSLADLIKVTSIPGSFRKKTSIKCCDGRCQKGSETIGFAGSGILMDDKTRERAIKESDISEITSHSDCGAARLAFAQAVEKFGTTNAEDYAKEWTQRQAEKFGLKYRHIDEKEFVKAIHHERGILFDATLRFNPHRFQGMPNFFLANDPAFGAPSYIGSVVEALTNIAMSDHGFGSLFSPEEPFYILIGARSEQEQASLEEISAEATAMYQNKVAIRSYVFA